MYKWVDADGSHHSFGNRFRQAYRIKLPKKNGGAHHLAYIQKLHDMSGSQLLRMAESHVEELGGTRLTLQDASFIHCGRHEFDLGFRSLLVHGETWYERHGYVVLKGISPRSQMAARDAMHAFSRIKVVPLRDVVRQQVALLKEGRSYTCDDGRLFSTVPPVTLAAASASTILRARRELLAIIESASHDARLGTWLPTLGCAQYAKFMRAMYGSRMASSMVALTKVGDVSTPTLTEFKRANHFRRVSHRILWGKDITIGRTRVVQSAGDDGTPGPQN
jgi:hypothetical protein